MVLSVTFRVNNYVFCRVYDFFLFLILDYKYQLMSVDSIYVFA